MSKAILVTDMPDYCSECPLCIEVYYRDTCAATGYWIMSNNKPDWCPLKPMPEVEEPFICEELCDVEDWYDSGYIDGRNACINEMIGN